MNDMPPLSSRNCPQCGEAFSGSSLTCGSCGFTVREGADGIPSFETLANQFEETLIAMKAGIRTGVFASLKARGFILMPLLMALVTTIALLSPEKRMLNIIIFSILPMLSPMILVVYLRIKRAVSRVRTDLPFLRKNAVERLAIMQRHYGNDAEIRKLLAEYNNELKNVQRAARREKANAAVGFGIVAFLFVFVLWLFPPFSNNESDAEDAPQSNYWPPEPVRATPLRAELNGPLDSWLDIEPDQITIEHEYISPTDLIVSTRIRVRVHTTWIDPGNIQHCEITLALIVLDSTGTPLYRIALNSPDQRHLSLTDQVRIIAAAPGTVHEIDFVQNFSVWNATEATALNNRLRKSAQTPLKFLVSSTLREIPK